MKVGILTFHDGFNHGAFLQCYCLQKFLEEKGNEVEVINYRDKKSLFKEYYYGLKTKNPLLLFSKIRRVATFLWQRRHLNTGSRVYTESALSSLSKDFDIVFLGSDEIWNVENDLYAKIEVYFGKGISSTKIASFAPSMGNSSLKSFEETNFPKLVRKLNFVSVRDSHSFNIVKKWREDTFLVCDPTLLYANTEKLAGDKAISGDYILIYATQIPSNVERQISQFAHEQKLKVVSIGYGHKLCDVNILSVNSFQLLSYFKYAEYVLTSTFHGTIFSCLFKRPFISVPSKEKTNKIQDLLNWLSLKDRLYSTEEQISNQLLKPIDYRTVGLRIEGMRLKSSEYIALCGI